MTCREAREQIIESFDIGARDSGEVLEHLQGCADCQREWDRDHAVFDKLRPVERIVASHAFLERTMTAITIEAHKESTRRERLVYGWPRWATVACAAILLLVLIPMLPLGNSNRRGIALLAQSVQAMAQLRSLHITGQIRTLPGDNFELIGTDLQFLPIEMWRDYRTPLRWRVEKPGRVVVMDGQESILYLPDRPEAMKGTPQTGFVAWLLPLLSPEKVLENELAAAKAGDSKAQVSEADGQITLTVTRKPRGDFRNDWLKNKAIDYADHTRVYTFDAATKLLTRLSVVVHSSGRDVSVLELNSFTYNQPQSDSLYALQLPADINWMIDPDAMPAPPALSGPREAALFFFDSLSRKDWDDVQRLLPTTKVPDETKTGYGGLTVVHVGDPFRSGLYPGWFVPYEVRLENGETKQYNLAVRSDNPEKRWIVDGGW